MSKSRSRAKGYFITILQSNDSYFRGESWKRNESTRREIGNGFTIMDALEESMKYSSHYLFDGEHLWIGYQSKDGMPSIKWAWRKERGKICQYRGSFLDFGDLRAEYVGTRYGSDCLDSGVA